MLVVDLAYRHSDITQHPFFTTVLPLCLTPIIPSCMQKFLLPYSTTQFTSLLPNLRHRLLSTSLHMDCCLAVYDRRLLFPGITLDIASAGVNNKDICNLDAEDFWEPLNLPHTPCSAEAEQLLSHSTPTKICHGDAGLGQLGKPVTVIDGLKAAGIRRVELETG